jgi:hypothetical protein
MLDNEYCILYWLSKFGLFPPEDRTGQVFIKMKLLHLAKSRISSGKGIPLVSISDSDSDFFFFWFALCFLIGMG